MSLFNKGKTPRKTEKITPKIAQEIYALLASGYDETGLFIKKGISFAFSIAVIDEIRRIEAEVMSIMSEKLCKSRKELIEGLKSELLSIEIIVTDIVQYYPFYTEKKRSWEEFRESFKVEM